MLAKARERRRCRMALARVSAGLCENIEVKEAGASVQQLGYSAGGVVGCSGDGAKGEVRERRGRVRSQRALQVMPRSWALSWR